MNIGALTASIRADIGPLKAGMRQAVNESRKASREMQTSMQKFNVSIKKAGQSMRTMGRNMNRYVSLPMAAAGAAAFKMAMDYEASMAKVTGLVGVAKDVTEAWTKEILKIAPALGKSPKELAEAMFFITSAGIKGAEAMDVLKMSAKASVAGLGETKIVADLLTSAMNAYGKANLNAAQATDILVAAVREGKAEATDLAGSFGKVLPISAEMGVSFDQVAAAIAAMTRTGTNAQVASTQLRAIFASLMNPAENAEQAMMAMGTSSAKLRETMRGPRGLAGALEDISSLTKKYGETAVGEVIPNIRALMGVLDLMGKNAEDNKIIFENLTDATGSLDKAFKSAADTALHKWNVAMASVKTGLTSFGMELREVVGPIIEGFGKRMQGLTKWFDELLPSQKKVVIAIGGLVAAFGPLLTVMGLFMTTVIPGLVTAFGALKLAMISLNTFMLANPFTAALMGIGLAVALLLPKFIKWQKSLKRSEAMTIDMAAETKRLGGHLDVLTAAGIRAGAGLDKLTISLGTYNDTVDEANTKAVNALGLKEINKQLKEAYKAFDAIKSLPTEDLFGNKLDYSEGITQIMDVIDALKARKKAIEDGSIADIQAVGLIAAMTKELEILEKQLIQATTKGTIGKLNTQIEALNRELKELKEYVGTVDIGSMLEMGGAKDLPDKIWGKGTDVRRKAEETAKIFGWTLAKEMDKIPKLNESSIDWDALAADAKKYASAADQLAQQVNQAFTSALVDGFTAIGEGLGNLFSGAASGEDLFDSLISSVTGFMKAMGQALIAAGVASEAFQNLFGIGGGVGGIAAGVALIAAAGLVQNIMKQGPQAPALKDGGIAVGRTLVEVGDYNTSRINPEVIMPASDLDRYMSNKGFGGELTLRVSPREFIFGLKTEDDYQARNK